MVRFLLFSIFFLLECVCDCWCCFVSVQIMVNTLHGRTTQHKHNTTRNKNEELIQFYFDVNFIHIHIGDMSCVCALSLAHVPHLKHVLPEPPEWAFMLVCVWILWNKIRCSENFHCSRTIKNCSAISCGDFSFLVFCFST